MTVLTIFLLFGNLVKYIWANVFYLLLFSLLLYFRFLSCLLFLAPKITTTEGTSHFNGPWSLLCLSFFFLQFIIFFSSV